MARTSIESHRQSGLAIAAGVGSVVMGASLAVMTLIHQVTFWPLAGAATMIAVGVDRLLILRTASIIVDGDSLVLKSHLGLRAQRRTSSLLTIEWHEAWRSSIVFNFEHIGDNVTLSAQGFNPDEIQRLAATVDRPFLRGADLYGTDDEPRDAER